ncbi:heme NO-binding domain-containing protein [Legionella sp. km772]|uniref:heme NO-binding domain-containing protein n=1 Tax=Legionella sp. km772 TaxID=2498111 RepID=UPI0013156C90|nr:heme NO-binding domain-containing protein [Legionella sp. km772]
MVGLVQKLLFSMIRTMAGEEVLAQIKQQAGIPPAQEYQMNNVYSDEEWQRLVRVTFSVLGMNEEQGNEAFAAYFLKETIQRFPTWFSMSKNSYEFLSMQPTIHNCFATSVLDKTSREAINDKFRIEQLPNKLITHYRSPNQHCLLYLHLAQKVVQHFQDEALIEEKMCMKQGASKCEIHINWTKLGTSNERLSS